MESSAGRRGLLLRVMPRLTSRSACRWRRTSVKRAPRPASAQERAAITVMNFMMKEIC